MNDYTRYNIKLILGSRPDALFLDDVSVTRDTENQQFVFENEEFLSIHSFNDIIQIYAEKDSNSIDNRIIEQCKKVGKVAGIKLRRQLAGEDLKKAKEYVDKLYEKGLV